MFELIPFLGLYFPYGRNVVEKKAFVRKLKVNVLQIPQYEKEKKIAKEKKFSRHFNFMVFLPRTRSRKILMLQNFNAIKYIQYIEGDKSWTVKFSLK